MATENERGDADEENIVAVIDTNVMIDVYSCHDYRRKLDPSYASKGDDAWFDPDVEYRGGRARDGLLLGVYLAKVAATTYGSHGACSGS